MSGKPNPLAMNTQVLLYLAVMAIGTGQTVVFAILPMLGRELGIDQLVINWPALGIYYEPKEQAITALTSVTSLAFFIGAPFWGRRSDVIGRKPVIIIGLAGYALGTYFFNGMAEMGFAGLLTGFTLYAVFIMSRIAMVLLMSATLPATSAYMVDSTVLAQRTASLSRLGAASQIGSMIGPAFAWFVVFGFLAPLYIQATVTLLVAVVLWFYLPESERVIDRNKVIKKLSYFDARYRKYLLIGLIIYTMLGMVQMTLGFYFEDRLGLEREAAALQFSLAMVFSSTAMLFAQLFIVQRWTSHPLRLLQFGLPFVIAGFACIAYAEGKVGLMLGMSLFGLGMGMAGPGYSVTATFTVHADEQGGLAGLTSSSSALGFVFGPLLGGYIYRSAPELTYWVAAAVLLPMWVYALFIRIPRANSG